MKKILKQVDVQSVKQRADDTVSITFISSLEQTPKEFMDMHNTRKTTGTLYYKSDEGLSTEEISQIDKVVLDKPNGKSQSERLRNALYVLCKQKKGSEPTKEEFAKWYNNKMNRFITHVIDQIETK
jgi:hypothetical protein